MFSFVKFSLVNAFPGFLINSIFQRNHCVSEFIIESFTGHAVWVWSRSLLYLPTLYMQFRKAVAYWALRLQSIYKRLTK